MTLESRERSLRVQAEISLGEQQGEAIRAEADRRKLAGEKGTEDEFKQEGSGVEEVITPAGNVPCFQLSLQLLCPTYFPCSLINYFSCSPHVFPCVVFTPPCLLCFRVSRPLFVALAQDEDGKHTKALINGDTGDRNQEEGERTTELGEEALGEIAVTEADVRRLIEEAGDKYTTHPNTKNTPHPRTLFAPIL